MALDGNLDDDEYVAKLLAEDAKKSSLRYAQQGLSAFFPRRPVGAAPKPNTRFLKAIVRDADSHNAALKKKEELEARIRQRKLDSFSEDIRSQECMQPRKRRRYDDKKYHSISQQMKDNVDHRRRNVSLERSRSREHRDRRRRHLREGRISHLGDRSGQGQKRHRSRSPSRLRSEDRHDRARRADKTDRPRLRRRSRSTQPASPRNPQNVGSDHGPTSRFVVPGDDQPVDDQQSTHDAYDSDPLEMLVGPLRHSNTGVTKEKFPIRSKGRGAHKPSGAAMDGHFSSDYDPGLDLHPESELEDEKEDWAIALEALRDREMFKQKQAERLREAGFGEAEIRKWEDNGKEKGVEDVKWIRKGEGREWDLGKVDQIHGFGQSVGL